MRIDEAALKQVRANRAAIKLSRMNSRPSVGNPAISNGATADIIVAPCEKANSSNEYGTKMTRCGDSTTAPNASKLHCANKQLDQYIDIPPFNNESWRSIQAGLQLSPRELDITKGIFSDLTEKMIAADLCISRHTVHAHLRRIFRKLHVQTKVGLVICVAKAAYALNWNQNANDNPDS